MHLSAFLGKEVTIPFDEAEFDRLLKIKTDNSVYRSGSGTLAVNEDYDPRWQIKW